ncbi:KamA family protein, partial [bacterium]|nr:KamA family protein [bacterium]
MHRYETIENLEKLKINAKSHRILNKILDENPRLKTILLESESENEINGKIRTWVLESLGNNSAAMAYHNDRFSGRKSFEALEWSDYAAIRILDYIDHAGQTYEDLNLRGAISISNPFRFLWLAARFGRSGAEAPFFIDMLHLFRQFTGISVRRLPTRREVIGWMNRHPSGLDRRVQFLREENRDRILRVIIQKMDQNEISSSMFQFKSGLSDDEKFATALEWWKLKNFHLVFAVRTPDLLNEMLEYSLRPDTMDTLHSAYNAGIPFFVNPYYLSLLNVRAPKFAVGADLAIRDYIFYSNELVNEFDHIVAWEKEDEVEPGKPNVAGWTLPTINNIHRRYPETAILIPDTVGRACGGLCSSCQRMYDFQSGNLNFKLEKLRPVKTWSEKLNRLMQYFENDSQLRDILITGGDALMNSNKSLENILDAVYEMALRKRKANKKRPDGKKYAEMTRIRLGTRLLVYLPMRVTNNLIRILTAFREKAKKIGFRQFIIQTHFESAMEVTSEVKTAVKRIISAGWIITNQHVFTSASSRRGHTAKLRQTLNDIGILPY